MQVADITFNFWYRLSELLYKKEKEKFTAVFKPFISRLIVALCRHCQYESDMVGEINQNLWLVSTYAHMASVKKWLIYAATSSVIRRYDVSYQHHSCNDVTSVCFQEGIPNSGDEFSDFRYRVSELIKDVVFIVSSSSVFAQVSVT